MEKIHLIGNAHLDPVWMWRWQEGYTEILQTFRSALDRMKEFPEVKFTSAASAYYEWIEKSDPEMFEEIRKRVKEGRWCIVGGWFLQPDCNIPDGESFARHALIAQRYFKEKFGITAKCGYNVDSFGHNASLPKILKASGMDNYVFMRPSPEEKDIKESLFNWESDDGSSVTAFRIPVVYNVEMKRFETFDEVKNIAEREKTEFMMFYGVGNHGGGPTIKLINAINNKKTENMIYSTPNEYFESVDKSKLPVVREDLQHHARGCYSAETSVKKGNRQCENNLIAAERFSVMAKELVGAEYPEKKLKKAWKNLLFNQFHDILGGCAIESAYKDAGYLFGETMSITEQVINNALQKIAWNIDTVGDVELPAYRNKRMRIWEHEILGTPVVVFNSHPWEVTETVSVYTYNAITYMTDDEGKVIPHQMVRGEHTNDDDRNMTAFNATIPAMGYRVYRFFLEKENKTKFEKELKVTSKSLENSKIKVEFSSKTGDICKLYDKIQNKYIIDRPCGAVVLDETDCDTWAHGKEVLGQTIGEFSDASFTVLEDGNVRATLRVTTKYKGMVMVRDFSIIPGSDRVSVNVRVNFDERHRALKLAFPAINEVTAKIPYGTITKKLGTGEEPCGSWIASGGLCVANDSKYGYDTTENEMRLSVLRTAIYCDHFGKRDDLCRHMDMGMHEFSYSVFPYKNPMSAERAAEELNCKARVIMGSFKKGRLAERFSGFKTESDNVMVSAVKKSEDNSENIIRICEMNGEETDFAAKLFGKEIKTKLSHNELKTLTDSGKELSLTEW